MFCQSCWTSFSHRATSGCLRTQEDCLRTLELKLAHKAPVLQNGPSETQAHLVCRDVVDLLHLQLHLSHGPIVPNTDFPNLPGNGAQAQVHSRGDAITLRLHAQLPRLQSRKRKVTTSTEMHPTRATECIVMIALSPRGVPSLFSSHHATAVALQISETAAVAVRSCLPLPLPWLLPCSEKRLHHSDLGNRDLAPRNRKLKKSQASLNRSMREPPSLPATAALGSRRHLGGGSSRLPSASLSLS